MKTNHRRVEQKKISQVTFLVLLGLGITKIKFKKK